MASLCAGKYRQCFAVVENREKKAGLVGSLIFDYQMVPGQRSTTLNSGPGNQIHKLWFHRNTWRPIKKIMDEYPICLASGLQV